MATRRSFTFGSLVLALTGASSARAESPQQAAPQKLTRTAPGNYPERREGAPHLRTHLRAERKGGALLVTLAVTNRAPEPIEIVVERGSRPGAWLLAAIEVDGETFDLAPILEGDRREFMSRMGPIPRYAPLASGSTHQMGPYKFAWPKGVVVDSVHITGGLDSDLGVSDIEHTVTLQASAKAKRS